MFEKGTHARAIVGSFAFFLVAPFVVAGVIPFVWVGWALQPPLFGLPSARTVGAVGIVVGLACLLDCFARFALVGRGTPGPVEQTEILVISGLYRFLRNPMYVCVLIVVSGQALLFGQVVLFGYVGALAIVFHIFVVLYEERSLRQRFGRSHQLYCIHVRRWWPRLTPWRETGAPNP